MFLFSVSHSFSHSVSVSPSFTCRNTDRKQLRTVHGRTNSHMYSSVLGWDRDHRSLSPPHLTCCRRRSRRSYTDTDRTDSLLRRFSREKSSAKTVLCSDSQAEQCCCTHVASVQRKRESRERKEKRTAASGASSEGEGSGSERVTREAKLEVRSR